MKAPAAVQLPWICLALLAAGGPAASLHAQPAASLPLVLPVSPPVPLVPVTLSGSVPVAVAGRVAKGTYRTAPPGEIAAQGPTGEPALPLRPYPLGLARADASIPPVPGLPDAVPAAPAAPARATAPSDTGLPGVAEVEAPAPVAPPRGRPLALPPLYVSFAALQVADLASTGRALEAGGREANPIVRGLTDQSAAMLAVKAGATVGTIYLAERLWKRNRPAAIALMVALNGAYAAIVAHNYSGRWQH